MLSIWELNKSRTSVVFEKGIATAYNNKTNKVLFKAIGQNGLYLLDSKKNQNSEFYIISRNKPLLNEFNKGLVSQNSDMTRELDKREEDDRWSILY